MKNRAQLVSCCVVIFVTVTVVFLKFASIRLCSAIFYASWNLGTWRSAFCKREDTLAAAAEARTQIPMEGVGASSLDEIEPAQRMAGHGE